MIYYVYYNTFYSPQYERTVKYPEQFEFYSEKFEKSIAKISAI